MKRLALLVLLVAACVVSATARADGDPASDYLLGTQVFLPFDLKVPKPKQRELISLVHDVNASGYTIRVALIGSAYDMGAVTSLWRKPRPYAKFLGAELQFVYKKRLLIVMPQGFGFNWAKHPSTREYAVLAKIPVGKGPQGLVDAAGTAVQRLAAASGVKVARHTATSSSGGHSMARDRAVIILGAVSAVAVAVLLRLALRRKRP